MYLESFFETMMRTIDSKIGSAMEGNKGITKEIGEMKEVVHSVHGT